MARGETSLWRTSWQRPSVRASLAGGAVLLAGLAQSGAAWACPVCAQGREGGPLEYVALGALIVMPWFAAAAIGLWIRRGVRKSGQEGAPTAVK